MKASDYLPEQGEIGPFPGSVKPPKPGLYKRITKKGNTVWAYYSASRLTKKWGKFSSSKDKAVSKANSASRHQSLPWIGLADET